MIVITNHADHRDVSFFISLRKGQEVMQALKISVVKQWVQTGILGLGSVLALTAHAGSVALPFQTHAAYFSAEINASTPLDPQVFVAEPHAARGIGPQQIRHVAGIRNARIADLPTLPILNANGEPLHMTLGAWLGAKGEAVLTPIADGKEKITVSLSNLIPGGHYSLFENHFDQKPTGFTPLDGNGATTSFVATADGKAIVTAIAPSELTHDNAVLVVYHSDGKPHGQSRGAIGVNAHHQLIARP